VAKFVTLWQFTDQGIRNVKDSPARVKAANKKAESMGMKVIATLYTQGPYDLITISEVSDEKMANAFALATVAQGNVRSTTMRAFDPDEFEAIVKMMP